MAVTDDRAVTSPPLGHELSGDRAEFLGGSAFAGCFLSRFGPRRQRGYRKRFFLFGHRNRYTSVVVARFSSVWSLPVTMFYCSNPPRRVREQL